MVRRNAEETVPSCDKKMKVFVVSDVHVDYQASRQWLLGLSAFDYKRDVLILAGDLTDDLKLLADCLCSLSSKFNKVLFVPGNHELWVVRDKFRTSLEKFEKVLQISADCGASTDVYAQGGLSIVPLFGWYDFSFGPPGARLMEVWSDFSACAWPDGYTEQKVTNYFMDRNAGKLNPADGMLISFSHFLPRIDLMPSFVRPSQRYLYPVLGSTRLGEQVSALKPKIHVYGHSHVNQRVEIEGVYYVNNAYGYPSETGITSKELLCIYEE